MCSKAPHGTTPTLTSAIKISSQTATYINSRHYSLSWLILRRPRRVKTRSHGITRSHKAPQGRTRSHKASQGLTRSHKVSKDLTRPHKVSQGLTRPHKASQGHTGSQEGIRKCVPSRSGRFWERYIIHTLQRHTAHTAGNSIESQHGLLVIQWSPSMACWSSQLSVHSLIVVPAQRA